MADGQDYGLLAIKSVKRNVAAASEGDDPFPEFRRHMFSGAASCRLVCEGFDMRSDGLHGFGRCRRVLLGQKQMQTLNVA